MSTSDWVSIGAVLISFLSLRLSYLSRKSSLLAEMRKELSDIADNCNKFINPQTLGHTAINQEISEIVTSILYARDHLKDFYKKHWIWYLDSSSMDMIRYLYRRLHTSNIELIKNDLYISNFDPYTSPQIIDQHAQCKKFLSQVISEYSKKAL